MDRRRLIAQSAHLLLLAALLAGCVAADTQEPDVLTVAVLAPFSGDFAALGQSVRNGVVLAFEAWNQQGGVLGKTVKVILRDTECSYETAREVAEAAILEDGVRFIIGAVCGDASEGVAQVAMTYGALQISPASVDLDLTLDDAGEIRPLVFRVPSADPAQGVAAATFVLDSLALETAGVLYAEGSRYGAALADAFAETFEAGGGEVIVRKTYARDAEVFYDELEDVRERQPEVLYMPGYYDVINRLVPQARTFGLLQVILGSDGWDSPDLNRRSFSGTYFTTHYFPGEPRAAIQTWIQTYEARYIVAPDALATLGYDTANVLLSAIEAAGTLEPAPVAETMAEVTFETLSGPLSFDEAHNPVRSMIVVKVQSGEFVFAGRVEVEER